MVVALSLHNLSGAQRSPAPLTDGDVIQMVKSGKSDADVLATIRSSRTNFDLSPEGCKLLIAAHVSRTILNAIAAPGQPPCASTLPSSKPQTSAAGPLLKNGTPTLLGDGSVQAPPGGAGALSPQTPPPAAAAKSAAGSPGANVAQKTSAVSDYRQPPGGQPVGASVAQKTSAVSDYRQPPGNKPSSTAKALRPVKLARPKALRKVANSLSKQNASIIAVLLQQRQTAAREASAMKLGIRSAASTMPARTTVASINAKGSAPQGLGPENTQAAPGNLQSSMTHAPSSDTTVLTCTAYPTPRILRVSGGEGPSVFTPESKYNLYTIVGCGFGATNSGNSAYIYGANGFRANLNVDFWSDNGITAHLDPWLAGVVDQDNVTLVVAPAGKQALQKSAYKFYAARGMPAPDGSDQEVPLAYNSMPQSRVAIFNVNNFIAGFDQLPSNATSNFPSFSFQGTPVAGWVFRYAYEHDDRIATFRAADCFINDVGFNGAPCQQYQAIGSKYQGWQLKSDTWDLSKLLPQFQISSYQLYVSTLDPASLCGSWDNLTKPDAYLDGDWDFNLNTQNQIVITWPVYRCSNQEFGTRNNMNIQSAYGLSVSVMGPRCIDPWSGQKDQNCMNTVHQMLN